MFPLMFSSLGSVSWWIVLQNTRTHQVNFYSVRPVMSICDLY